MLKHWTVLEMDDNKKDNIDFEKIPVKETKSTTIVLSPVFPFYNDPDDNIRKSIRKLKGQGIIADELKGCRKFTRDTKNHLLIRLYCKTVKIERNTLVLGWIDYQKVYDLNTSLLNPRDYKTIRNCKQ